MGGLWTRMRIQLRRPRGRRRLAGLVLQPHFGMFGALSLVVAAAGAGLVESSPVGPVIGVRLWVRRTDHDGPESFDLVAG